MLPRSLSRTVAEIATGFGHLLEWIGIFQSPSPEREPEAYVPDEDEYLKGDPHLNDFETQPRDPNFGKGPTHS